MAINLALAETLSSALYQVNKARVLILTYCNAGYTTLTRNTLASIIRAGCPWTLVVFCLDRSSYQELTALQEPQLRCFDFSNQVANLSQQIQCYGNLEYKKIVFKKLQVIEAVCHWGLDDTIDSTKKPSHFFYLDSDVIVLQDPIPFLLDYLSTQQAQVAFQCGEGDCQDNIRICTGRSGIHKSQHCFNYCSGVFVSAINPDTTELFSYNAEVTSLNLAQTPLDGDQDLLNRRIKAQPDRWAITALPPLTFPNGSINNHRPRPSLTGCYLIHYNFAYEHQKVGQMKYNGHWFMAN